MNDPLEHTRKELEAAHRAVTAMKSARSFGEFEAAWQDFLSRLERAWHKSKDAYADGEYAPWRGQHAARRNEDALLRYLKQARDAEEHTVEETVARQAGGIGIGPSSGKSLHIGHMTIDQGNITIQGAKPGITIAVIPDRVRLLPAQSRGQVTQPPTEHLGKPLGRTDPVSVAEAGLEYYEGMVGKADHRFGGTP